LRKFIAVLFIALGLTTPSFANPDFDLGPATGVPAPSIGTPSDQTGAPLGLAAWGSFALLQRVQPRTASRAEAIVITVTFVTACRNGHLSEFPWSDWVHQEQLPEPERIPAEDRGSWSHGNARDLRKVREIAVDGTRLHGRRT
jgi:hypothetical protein